MAACNTNACSRSRELSERSVNGNYPLGDDALTHRTDSFTDVELGCEGRILPPNFPTNF